MNKAKAGLRCIDIVFQIPTTTRWDFVSWPRAQYQSSFVDYLGNSCLLAICLNKLFNQQRFFNQDQQQAGVSQYCLPSTYYYKMVAMFYVTGPNISLVLLITLGNSCLLGAVCLDKSLNQQGLLNQDQQLAGII